jgi:hypothetical protein
VLSIPDSDLNFLAQNFVIGSVQAEGFVVRIGETCRPFYFATLICTSFPFLVGSLICGIFFLLIREHIPLARYPNCKKLHVILFMWILSFSSYPLFPAHLFHWQESQNISSLSDYTDVWNFHQTAIWSCLGHWVCIYKFTDMRCIKLFNYMDFLQFDTTVWSVLWLCIIEKIKYMLYGYTVFLDSYLEWLWIFRTLHYSSWISLLGFTNCDLCDICYFMEVSLMMEWHVFMDEKLAACTRVLLSSWYNNLSFFLSNVHMYQSLVIGKVKRMFHIRPILTRLGRVEPEGRW